MKYYTDIKNQHRKFGISHDGPPRMLSKEEHLFRIGAMLEEAWEYAASVINTDMTPDQFREKIIGEIKELPLAVESTPALASQLDALVDLCTFAIDTAARQGFDFDAAWAEVVKANFAKELAGESEKSKRGFKKDLIKPEGWQAPDIEKVVAPMVGVVVIEGPPHSGKTLLAKQLATKFNGAIIGNKHYPYGTPRIGAVLEEVLGQVRVLSKTQLVILDGHWVSEFMAASASASVRVEKDLYQRNADALTGLGAQYVWAMPAKEKTIEKHMEAITSTPFQLCHDESERRTPLLGSLLDVMRYTTFVLGGELIDPAYRVFFPQRISQSAFMEKWRYEDSTAINLLPGFVYDRFEDPHYDMVVAELAKRLRK